MPLTAVCSLCRHEVGVQRLWFSSIQVRPPHGPHKTGSKQTGCCFLLSRSNVVCISISEEEPGPLRSDNEGKNVTKVSRTFSYLRNKMYKKTRVSPQPSWTGRLSLLSGSSADLLEGPWRSLRVVNGLQALWTQPGSDFHSADLTRCVN